MDASSNQIDSLKLDLKEVTTISSNYYDSSVYPSNSPINKKSSQEDAFNLNGNNINNNNTNNENEINLDETNHKTNTTITTTTNLTNSDDFNKDIYKVNSDTYRIDDTIRATSETSDQISNNYESSLLSVRSEKEILSDQDQEQQLQPTINNNNSNTKSQIMSNNNIFANSKEEESDLVFDNIIKSSSSIKVNREKSFIVDSSYNNKTNVRSAEKQSTKMNSIEMNNDFNHKPLVNSTKENNLNESRNNNQHSIEIQPNMNDFNHKPIAAQVTLNNNQHSNEMNNLNHSNNNPKPQYSVEIQPNFNDFNHKPLDVQVTSNSNQNHQTNNNSIPKNFNLETNIANPQFSNAIQPNMSDFNQKSMAAQVTLNNNIPKHEPINNNQHSNEINNFNHSNNNPQFSNAIQPNMNDFNQKQMAAQVTLTNNNDQKHESNEINFNNQNQQMNNNSIPKNFNFEVNMAKPQISIQSNNQQNHTYSQQNYSSNFETNITRPQYNPNEFHNKPIIQNNENNLDSTYTKKRLPNNDNIQHNLKINLNDFENEKSQIIYNNSHKNNVNNNPDYYEKSPPNTNQSNDATENFLNEIRMSNQSFIHTPLSSNRKKMFSNPGSAHRPPHTLPPLNASKKYMSYSNNNAPIDIENNYESIFNGIETYSNTPSNASYPNQSRTSINHSSISLAYNSNQVNDQLFAANDNHNNNNNNVDPEFDALQSRRKLLHELSENHLAQNKYPIPSSRQSRTISIGGPNNNIQLPINNLNNNNNNVLPGTVFNETLSSNDMEELIDTMAKRRLAIKKLEIEMNRQHTRNSNLLRQSNFDPLYENDNSLISTFGLDNTTISYDPRTSLYQARTPNDLSSRLVNIPNSSILLNTNVRHTQPVVVAGTMNMVSHLQYPSDNRDAYSTYLAESVRPHYSAKRLISGGSYTASGLQINPNLQPQPHQLQQQQQQVFLNNNNQQPVISANTLEKLEKSTETDNKSTETDLSPPLVSMSNISLTARSNTITETKSTQTISIDELTGNSNKPKINNNQDLLKSKTIISERKPETSLTKEFTRAPTPNKAKIVESSAKVSTPIIASKKFEELSRAPTSIIAKKSEVLSTDKMPDLTQSSVIHNRTAFDISNSIKSSNRTLLEISKLLNQKFNEKLKGKKLFFAICSYIRFTIRIRKKSEETKLKYPNGRTGSASIFRIRLLEIISALHRVYLEPEGPIYGSLMTFVMDPNDMNILFDPNNSIYSACVIALCQNIEEIVQRVTEFMPKEGILGINPAKSALLNLISNGNKFADNYFWDSEKERLEFDEKNGKIIDVNRDRAILLLMGSTISRGLITTLLVKPVKFRLLTEEINVIKMNNIKILATVLYYIVRMVNDGNDFTLLKFPLEWQGSLFSDSKMSIIYKNTEVSTMLNRCQRLFKVWANEYVKRLQAHLN